jgi:hypothetical protein
MGHAASRGIDQGNWLARFRGNDSTAGETRDAVFPMASRSSELVVVNCKFTHKRK